MAYFSAESIRQFQWQRFFRASRIARSLVYVRIALLILCFILLVAIFTALLRQYMSARTVAVELRSNVEQILLTQKSAASVAKAKEDYSVVHKKSIFGKLETSSAEAAPIQAAPKSALALSLIGTYVSPGESSQAIIEDSKSRTQDVFVLGETVFDSAKLVAIQSDRVEIERDGNRETLLLEDSDGFGGGDAGSADGEVVVVNENELNAALDNLPLLLTQARAVPYFKDGQAAGLRLFAIKTGSMYEKVGLKNGDILKAINGSSLADMSQAMKLFEQLRQEKSISLEIERNRQKTIYQYRIQ